MKDFFVAAWPWLLLGISLAVFFASWNNNKEKENHCGTTGLSIGLVVGCALGSWLGHLASLMGPCMLFGYAIGLSIERKK